MVLEHTVVRTDKDTLEKLKQKAGNKSVPRYLRDIANGVEQVPVPGNAIDLLQKSILEKYEAINEDLKRIRQSDDSTTTLMSGFQKSIDELQVAIIHLAGKIGATDDLKQFENLNDIIEEQEYNKTHGYYSLTGYIPEGTEILDAAGLKKLQQEYNIPDSVIEEIRKEFEEDESESDEQ